MSDFFHKDNSSQLKAESMKESMSEGKTEETGNKNEVDPLNYNFTMGIMEESKKWRENYTEYRSQNR